MSSLTLTAAVSVSVITEWPPGAVDRSDGRPGTGCSSRHRRSGSRRPARPGTACGRRASWKPTTSPPPSSSTKPSTRPRCRLHTSSGWASASSRNGQWAKADGRRRRRRPPSGSNPSVGHARRSSAPRGTDPVGQAAGVGPALLAARRRPASSASSAGRAGGQAQQHPGEHRERRAARDRARARRRRASSGAAAGPTPPRASLLDVEQADVTHALEVRPHGVQVQVEHARRSRPWPAAAATGPARGRWRTGCCRPSAFRMSRRGSGGPTGSAIP